VIDMIPLLASQGLLTLRPALFVAELGRSARPWASRSLNALPLRPSLCGPDLFKNGSA